MSGPTPTTFAGLDGAFRDIAAQDAFVGSEEFGIILSWNEDGMLDIRMLRPDTDQELTDIGMALAEQMGQGVGAMAS